MLDRGAVLSRYNVQVPAFDVGLLATALRGLMLLLVVVGAAWAMFELYRRLVRGSPKPDPGLASSADAD
jgi:hypothetical protein